MVKVSINLEEILSGARGNFEEQNKVLEPSTIITNYYITIINAYNNNNKNNNNNNLTANRLSPGGSGYNAST